MHTSPDRLNETKIIKDIRKIGQDIFDNQSINYSLSDSEPIENDRQIFPLLLKPHQQNSTQSKSKYAQNYTSPYRSSTSRSVKASTLKTDTSSGKKIRRKIFNLYSQNQQLETEKKEREKQKSKNKIPGVKSKYMVAEPLMKNLSGYIEKNIYGRLKTETNHLQMKKSKLSREESQKKWAGFIRKNCDWEAHRKESIRKVKLSEDLKASEEMKVRPTIKQPPKMNVEQCLSKLRRQTDKLKQRLDQYSFQPKVFDSYRKVRASPKKESAQKNLFQEEDDEKTKRKISLSNPSQLNFML